ncbi:peptidase inhibitor family I36 protein [Nocardia arthritidis]|uniref:peptidase inhibitor family I36 protein n=1 Tax=Nocardia arthritidis TaxID=228602 RepID=UPI000A060895
MRTVIASAAAIFTAMFLVGAPEAAAAPSCPKGSVCMWTGTNYTGRMLEWIPVVDSTSCVVTYPKGGAARSVVNRSGQSLTFWESSNCSGRHTNGATSFSDLGFDAYSVHWCRQC